MKLYLFYRIFEPLSGEKGLKGAHTLFEYDENLPILIKLMIWLVIKCTIVIKVYFCR